MSFTGMMFHFLLERLARREVSRVPEANLIMDDPAQNQAFTDSGREDNMLKAIYCYHALQASTLIRPGDLVLDLACGPGNQLVQIAYLNPSAHFIALDASSNMLANARATLNYYNIKNVKLIQGDMTKLAIDTRTLDCVICTMSIHHLPDQIALASMMCELRRVLKTGGGVYCADFGRLKRAKTQHYLAYDRADHQSRQFTQDFFASLQAAFSVKELRTAASLLGPDVQCYTTAIAPFMIIIKNMARRILDDRSQISIQKWYQNMSITQQHSFQILARWFSASGCKLPCNLA